MTNLVSVFKSIESKGDKEKDLDNCKRTYGEHLVDHHMEFFFFNPTPYLQFYRKLGDLAEKFLPIQFKGKYNSLDSIYAWPSIPIAKKFVTCFERNDNTIVELGVNPQVCLVLPMDLQPKMSKKEEEITRVAEYYWSQAMTLHDFLSDNSGPEVFYFPEILIPKWERNNIEVRKFIPIE